MPLQNSPESALFPRINIIAPGGKCQKSDISNGLEFLSTWGQTPTVPRGLLKEHPLYASPDSIRSKHLETALLENNSLDILWALRGGSGTSRLLDLLNNTPKTMPVSEKTIIGFSDITALLIYTNQIWGWKPIHGPTLNCLVKGTLSKKSTEKIKELVTTGTTSIFSPLKKVNEKLTGDILAPLTGGNLSLIQRSIGTPWQLNTKDKIVFFEDINEPPYRIAEILDHLLHAKILQNAKAVIFGDFSQKMMTSNKIDLMNFIIKDFSEHLQKPVFAGLPIGHFKENYPLQMGQKCYIQKHNNQIIFQQKLVLPHSF